MTIWNNNESRTSKDFLSNAMNEAASSFVKIIKVIWPQKVKTPMETIRNLSNSEEGKQNSTLVNARQRVETKPRQPKAVQMHDQWISRKNWVIIEKNVQVLERDQAYVSKL